MCWEVRISQYDLMLLLCYFGAVNCIAEWATSRKYEEYLSLFLKLKVNKFTPTWFSDEYLILLKFKISHISLLKHSFLIMAKC